MSAVEPSLWVIYQPLIVGFGAVVLGFVASAALELWKDHLGRQTERSVLRNALIFELRTFRQAIETQWLRPPKKKDGVATINIKLPRLIFETNRLDFGKLAYSEICALSDFERMLSVLPSIAEKHPEESSISGGYFYLKTSDPNDLRNAIQLIRYYSHRALDELERHAERRIDWRLGLPIHLRQESEASAINEPRITEELE